VQLSTITNILQWTHFELSYATLPEPVSSSNRGISQIMKKKRLTLLTFLCASSHLQLWRNFFSYSFDLEMNGMRIWVDIGADCLHNAENFHCLQRIYHFLREKSVRAIFLYFWTGCKRSAWPSDFVSSHLFLLKSLMYFLMSSSTFKTKSSSSQLSTRSSGFWDI
jgi:hypothetical protein